MIKRSIHIYYILAFYHFSVLDICLVLTLVALLNSWIAFVHLWLTFNNKFVLNLTTSFCTLMTALKIEQKKITEFFVEKARTKPSRTWSWTTPYRFQQIVNGGHLTFHNFHLVLRLSALAGPEILLKITFPTRLRSSIL